MTLLTSGRVLLPAAMLALSCGNRQSANAPAALAQTQAQTAQTQAAGSPNGAPPHQLGTYTGHYSKGMLVLVLNYLRGNIASGYDLHKGLRRNLNGTAVEKDGHITLELHEPGHNPADGIFYLTLTPADEKITGKWVPNDPSAAKGGPVELKWETEPWHTHESNGGFFGDLGELIFDGDGTCQLQYYPSGDSSTNAQLVTIRGNYEESGDTVRIEWQYNTRLPKMKMTLIKTPYVEGNDSTPAIAPAYKGDGVKFEESLAG